MKFLGIIISGAGIAFWIAIEDYWEYFKELLNEIHPYLAPVVLGILILIGGIAIFYEYKNSKSDKTQLETKEDSNSKFLYGKHLAEYFELITKNSESAKQSYFELISSLDDEKKDILKQHMYTYNTHPQTQVSLFRYYKLIREANQSLPINRNVLLCEIQTIVWLLKDAVKTYDGFEFDEKKFEDSLNLTKPFLDLKSERIYKTEFEKDLCFDIDWSNTVLGWEGPQIKNRGWVIAKADSQKTIDGMIDEILPHITKANMCRNKIGTAKNRIEYMSKNMDKIIDEILTLIRKGQPIIGVCNICKDFSHIQKYNSLLKRLNKYNSKETIHDEAWWQDDNYFKYKN